MIEIDLIRHVKVIGKPALYGCTDVEPIATENGNLLDYLITRQQTDKAYHNIICSPLRRCERLAQAFSSRCNLPLEVVQDFQEINFGCFDGVPFDDIPFSVEADNNALVNTINEKVQVVNWSKLDDFFQAPADAALPEAEVLADFYHRVTLAWQKIIVQHIGITTENKELKIPQRMLILTHGGVIRIILAHILQLDWQQASWHQKLQIGHGSLSRIVISQPYQEGEHHSFARLSSHQQYQKLHQQVTTIAMPLLDGHST